MYVPICNIQRLPFLATAVGYDPGHPLFSSPHSVLPLRQYIYHLNCCAPHCPFRHSLAASLFTVCLSLLYIPTFSTPCVLAHFTMCFTSGYQCVASVTSTGATGPASLLPTPVYGSAASRNLPGDRAMATRHVIALVQHATALGQLFTVAAQYRPVSNMSPQCPHASAGVWCLPPASTAPGPMPTALPTSPQRHLPRFANSGRQMVRGSLRRVDIAFTTRRADIASQTPSKPHSH